MGTCIESSISISTYYTLYYIAYCDGVFRLGISYHVLFVVWRGGSVLVHSIEENLCPTGVAFGSQEYCDCSKPLFSTLALCANNYFEWTNSSAISFILLCFIYNRSCIRIVRIFTSGNLLACGVWNAARLDLLSVARFTGQFTQLANSW